MSPSGSELFLSVTCICAFESLDSVTVAHHGSDQLSLDVSDFRVLDTSNSVAVELTYRSAINISLGGTNICALADVSFELAHRGAEQQYRDVTHIFAVDTSDDVTVGLTPSGTDELSLGVTHVYVASDRDPFCRAHRDADQPSLGVTHTGAVYMRPFDSTYDDTIEIARRGANFQSV
ncbi:hypothetical protein CTAYLR_009193 [Chrysophaeum taylorii]|uniref:Uncharacterized protein n=1 Tax=Chrysophaeum taylorii TaxID=2483200 RepID=A0AAD7UM31_9STRA|nr:hypothetical protein CTAYLR_009193 [Chrysophaeum taylorii]